MDTMKAFAIVDEAGQRFELVDVLTPSPGPRDLIVQNRAIGVGIHDSYFLPAEKSLPFPIGIEAAGIIESLGAHVRGDFKVGDRIAYVSVNQHQGGTWAEYSAVSDDSLILPIPQGMSFERAAAIPVVANTVLRALRPLSAIRKGGSIFIAGASGAIGTFAVQLARARGWAVSGSASSQNHEYLLKLGAEMVVDYRDPDWQHEVLRWRPAGVDGMLAIQPNTAAPGVNLVKDGGVVVAVSGDQVADPGRAVTVCGLDYSADVQQDLLSLMHEVNTEILHLEIEKIYPFSEAAAALSKVQTRRARGKVVLSAV